MIPQCATPLALCLLTVLNASNVPTNIAVTHVRSSMCTCVIWSTVVISLAVKSRLVYEHNHQPLHNASLRTSPPHSAPVRYQFNRTFYEHKWSIQRRNNAGHIVNAGIPCSRLFIAYVHARRRLYNNCESVISSAWLLRRTKRISGKQNVKTFRARPRSSGGADTRNVWTTELLGR